MDFITAGPLAALHATVLLIFVVASCVSAGMVMISRLPGAVALSKLERALFAFGCGFIVAALGLLSIGIAGQLRMFPCIAWLYTLLFLRGMPRLRADALGRVLSAIAAELGAIHPVWLLAGGAALVLSWFQALQPPIGNDALAYHLYHAADFVRHGRVAYIPYARESLWPYQTEMFFTLGLLFEGTTLAQLFHWVFYPVVALLTYALTRRFYGRSAAAPAAAAFLFIPAAFAQSGHAYVDLSLAFFACAAVLAFALRRDIGGASAAILSGFMAGGAASTKYLGLGVIAILGVFWLCVPRSRFRNAALFAASCAAAAALWYVRSWMVIGNPVYPFFSGLFGSGYDFDVAAGVGMGKGLAALLLFYWNLTLYPQNFGGEMAGALPLLFVPLLLTRLRGLRASPSRELTAFAALYTVFLFTQSHQMRFYLSVLPVLCVGVGVAVYRAKESGRAVFLAAAAVFGITAVLHLGIYAYRTRHALSVVTGNIGGKGYLERYERSFRGAVFLARDAKPGATLYDAGEVRAFYIPPKIKVEFGSIPLDEEIRKSGRTLAQFLDERHFDYLWLEAQDSPAKLYDYVRSRAYEPAFSYTFTEGTRTFRMDIFKRAPDSPSGA